MIKADYEEIISTHRTKIWEARSKANRYLFIDTDSLTTYWYAQLGEIDLPRPTCDDFDLILFLDANVPFIQDGLRSNESNTDIAFPLSEDLLPDKYFQALCQKRRANDGKVSPEPLKKRLP